MRHLRLALSITTLVGLGGGALLAGGAPVERAELAGSVTGSISFTGEVAAAAALQMQADPFCASSHDAEVFANPVEVDAAGGLGNVVVHVTAAVAGDGPDDPALVNQVGCMYQPHVLAVRTGQTVVFRNSDQTLHNVNVQPRDNPGFNLGQPLAGMESRREFANPEIGIPVRCDVHPWMTGFLSVFDHPYFAVTGADGSFTIEGLPDGDWVLETWHETLGEQATQISVSGGAATEVDLGYSE